MPSSLHEVVVALMRQVPGFAMGLARRGGSSAAQNLTAREGSPDLSLATPTEQRADAVITLHDETGATALGIVAEVQLARDIRKPTRWLSYLASLHVRLGCPVILLTICTDDATARWAAGCGDLGGSVLLRPAVVGPSDIPVITDPDIARADLEMAMLSAFVHADEHRTLDAVFAALTPDDDRSPLYTDFLQSALPPAALTHLEHLMTATDWQYKGEFARTYFDQGKAEALLAVLTARGITVPDDERDRVRRCTDPNLLDTWLVKAATATTLTEVFG
ncbi:MAG: hypothetical protein H6523_15355 [Mycolicibacterium sp.]|nr:hypothetical protein [Mycolicibacterium sp.]